MLDSAEIRKRKTISYLARQIVAVVLCFVGLRVRAQATEHPVPLGEKPDQAKCIEFQHISSDGKVIPKDCNTCHTVLAQLESGTPLIRHEEGIPFEHPVDLGDLTQVTYSDCHTGGWGHKFGT
jgi:hypothetical protein